MDTQRARARGPHRNPAADGRHCHALAWTHRSVTELLNADAIAVSLARAKAVASASASHRSHGLPRQTAGTSGGSRYGTTPARGLKVGSAVQHHVASNDCASSCQRRASAALSKLEGSNASRTSSKWRTRAVTWTRDRRSSPAEMVITPSGDRRRSLEIRAAEMVIAPSAGRVVRSRVLRPTSVRRPHASLPLVLAHARTTRMSWRVALRAGGVRGLLKKEASR